MTKFREMQDLQHISSIEMGLQSLSQSSPNKIRRILKEVVDSVLGDVAAGAWNTWPLISWIIGILWYSAVTCALLDFTCEAHLVWIDYLTGNLSIPSIHRAPQVFLLLIFSFYMQLQGQ